jgi:hypothetical protein
VVSGTNLLDGNWHLLAAVAVPFDHINQIPGGYNFYLDGVAAGNSVGYGLMSNVVSDVYGTSLDAVGGGVAKYNWKGDIAYVAEFPTTLTTTQITNLYSAWKSACAGESTDARYARILRYAGFTGTTWLSAGLTRSMGPATDIEGTDALSALQSVVDTESGQHHVRATGTVRFMSRGDRYNAFVPTVTFGDGPGEYPYEDLALDFDPTHLANQVTVTQTSTGQKFAATDATSVQNYFPRILARSVNSTNALECQDAANYLLSRFKAPLTRVTSLKVHPAAVPALWPVVAGLDLGARIRVMRRPFGAPTIQVDCFVEQLQWDFDDKGDAWLTMECSAADTTPYGLFSAWHTTVNTTFAAGATSMVVNASADNTNPLASQLGVGQQLMIGQGTARQQTVTVTGVGATSPGWTTATVKFAATALGGNAGDVVSEVLPSGVTDPTTWDAVSKFDSSAFSY